MQVAHNFVFIENREVSLKILEENCDKKIVDDIINKIDNLAKLGFYEVTMVFSKYMNKQFIDKVKELENEITAGYYDLEDAELVKIKHKILNIKY